MSNGFSILKTSIQNLKYGSFIKRSTIVLELSSILSEKTIDTLLRKYRGSGYLLPVISIKEGLCKGIYYRSTKPLKCDANTTSLNKEYNTYFEEIINELGKDIFSNYVKISLKLSETGFIEKENLDRFTEKLINCLLSLGLLKDENNVYKSALSCKWNLEFTTVFDLYAYRNFISGDYLIEDKKQLTSKN